MKKKITIIVLVSTVTAAAACGLVLVAAYHGHQYIDTEGAGLSGYRQTSPYVMTTGVAFRIKEQLTPSRGDLAKITVPVQTSDDTPIHLQLLTDANTPVYETTIMATAATMALPVSWSFPPIADSAGRTYWLEISGQAQIGKLNFLSVDPDRFDGGELNVNATLISDKRIVVDWQFYTPNAWQTVIQRLAITHEGVWGHPVTIWCTFVLLCLSSLLTVAWCVYILFRQ